MIRSLRTARFLSLFLLLTSAAWATAPTISSTSPATNRLSISATSDISITFNQSMTNATLSSGTIKVYGSYRGYYSAAYSVSGNTVTINPDSSFKPGEVITVTVTTGVQNASNEAMASPRVYSFTVDATAGYNKFSSAVSYTAYGTGSGNHYSVMADLDKDGDIDIATTSSLYNIMSVMLNNGNGTYASAVTYTTLNAFDISAADVDGDGDMDLVVANNSAYGMSVFINNGSGAFGTRNDFAFTFPQSNAQFVVPVDIDGDGDIDVVTNDLTYNYLHIMKNNGSGSFTSTDKEFTTKLGALSAGDLDKDGDMDILAACSTVDSVEQMNNDGAGNLSMATRYYWTSTDGPTATLVADINSTFGDKQDLVWLNGLTNLLTYFKDGSGIPLFTADNVSVGGYPSQVSAVDVDTDSDLDLVVANYNDQTFSVLTNSGSGTGTFSQTTYNLPSYPDDLSTADIDGDGDMDVVTVNNNATVSVLKNYNGGHVTTFSPVNASLDQAASANIVVTFDENINSSTLTASTVKIIGSVSGRHTWTLSSYNSGTYTATINPAADFTPGERVTVTVTNGVQNGNAVALEYGSSSSFTVAADAGGTFAAKSDYAAGDQAQSVAVADLNGDGDADIVTANTAANTVSVLINNGDGTYATAVAYSVGTSPTSVAVGDVDGDGDADIVTTLNGADQLGRLLNNGSGVFGSVATFATSAGPNAVILVDMDRDGDLDPVYTRGTQMMSQQNNGSGSFSNEWGWSSGDKALTSADVDNDGDQDIIAVSYSGFVPNVYVARNGYQSSYGYGYLGTSASYTVDHDPSAVVAADFNGDGYVDIVTASVNFDNGTINYLANNQGLSFAIKVSYPLGTGAQPRGLAALDIDSDGDLDVVVANGAADSAVVFTNNGSGVFSWSGQFAVGDNPYGIAAADVNGDGVTDLVTANYTGDNASVLLGGTSAPTVVTSAASAVTQTAATLNGTVNANHAATAAKFAYKLASSGTYADTIVATPASVSGGAVTAITASLTGLQSATAYDFKAVGISGNGTGVGSVQSFTTTEYAIAVASTSPAANAVNLAPSANLTVTFNVPANADSLNVRTVIVNGSMSGPIAGVISYDGPSKTMTFNPTNNLSRGERVSLTLTGNIARASGGSFLTPQFRSYTVAAGGSGPGFFDVQTTSEFFSYSESDFLAADVDNDGDADLIGYYSNGPLTVSINNSGTFDAPAAKYSRPDGNTYIGDVAFADMDKDGYGDLIVQQTNNESFKSIVIMKNNGSGVFSRYDSIAMPSPWIYDLDVKDYNNDGKLDIAFANQNTLTVKFNSPGWTSSVTYTATQCENVTSSDIDNDGDIDIIAFGSGGILVFKNNGNGTFASPVSTTGYVLRLEALDLDGDGDVDLAYMQGGSAEFNVRLNNGTGTFGSAVTYTLAIPVAKMVSGDVDADGDIDLAFCYQNENGLNVAYNNGSGVFTQQAVYGARMPGFAMMDYDNDGDLDIIGKDYLSNVDLKILQNTAPTTPVTSASGVNITNDYGSQFNVNWTNGSGTGRIVVMKQGAAVSWPPSGSTTYSANASFGSGTNLGGGNYVVYNGTASNVKVTNLAVNTTYHIAVFEYNGLSGIEQYETSTPGTASEQTNATAGYPFDTTAGYALKYTSDRWDYNSNTMTLPSTFTVEMWVNASSVGSPKGVLTFGNSGAFMGMGLDGTGKFNSWIYDEDADENVTVTGTTTASVNQWYHVAVTGGTGAPLKIYVNGTLEGTSGGNIGLMPTSTGYWWIGGDWNNHNFSGQVDEFRYWSAIRSADSIRSNMHKTLSGIPENLAGYWQFNEGSGSQTADLVGDNPMDNTDGGSKQWVASTVPIGGGSNTSALSFQSGTQAIGNASLNMSDGFDNPVDVYVTEISGVPSNWPTGFGSATGGKYFVIDVFGDPGTFSANITLKYGPGVITAGQEADPGTIRLFKRPTNSTGTWTDIGGAIAANAATGEVTWNGITSFSQFMSVDLSAELPPSLTFSKADYADWTDPGNQDRITNNVWITREDRRGIFNIKQEESFNTDTYESPTGTEWAAGKLSDGVENLTFDSWNNTTSDEWGDKPNMVGHDMVVHLIQDNIYLDIKFNSWTPNNDGGGFSYTRSLKDLELISTGSSNLTATTATLSGQIHSKSTTATAYLLYGTVTGVYTDSVLITPSPIPADTIYSISATLTGLTSWTKYYYAFGASNGTLYSRSGEREVLPHTVTIWSKNSATMTFTKADNADYTLAANQDRITGDVWLTRGDDRGMFNIKTESGYNSNSPEGTEWGIGTTDDIGAITFSSWYNAHGGNPPSVVGVDQVVHIYNEVKKLDIYFDLKMTAWTQNGNGGGFSYIRGVAPLAAWATNATGVTGTTATLHGQVYSHASTATAYLLYGTSSGVYTDSVAASEGTVSAATLTDVSAAVSSLTSGATYYYTVAATQSGGAYLRGFEGSFIMMSSQAGNALAFDGSNDYVTVGNESDFDFVNAVTLEAWIKPTTTSGERGIVTKNDGGGAHPYQLRIQNGEITFGFYDGTWNPVTTSGANIPVGEWTHVAGTYDKTTAKIYINGVLAASENYTFNIPVNNQPLEIGRTNSNYFAGAIDEVRVWNVARTQQQIQDNMRAPFTSAQSGLVGYWQFNAGTGTELTNHGSGSSGTMQNFGNTASSGWVTSSAPIGPFVVSISSTVSGIGNTSATVSGSVYSQSLSATAKFLYGTTSGVYTDSIVTTPSSIDADAVTSVSASLSSLAPGVLYYVCLAGQNSSYYARSAEISVITYSSNPGYSLLLDGNDDYVNVPDNNALDLTSNFTLEAWIKPNGFNSMAGIISKYQDNGAEGYFIRLKSSYPYTGLEVNGMSTADGILSQGNWYHVAAVRDGGTWILYVNGSPVSLSGTPATILSNNNFLGIGVDYYVGGRYFNGYIDEVRVWNVVRTQQQIHDNMNTPFTSAQTGLVGYWQLNDGTGTLAHGFASGLNGTLTNFNFNTNSGWRSSDAPLPVELTSFTAESKRLDAELKWTTATEKNNYGFEVERSMVADQPAGAPNSTVPDRAWSKVSFVEGNGTSSAPKEYLYSDKVGKSGKYVYRLKVIDRDGAFAYSPEVEVSVGAVPLVFALEQNYPNPFNPATTIGFTIESSGLTTLKVFDIVGREVATLVNEQLESGVYHQYRFDASRFASGIYFARLTSNGKVQMKKMMLVK